MQEGREGGGEVSELGEEMGGVSKANSTPGVQDEKKGKKSQGPEKQKAGIGVFQGDDGNLQGKPKEGKRLGGHGRNDKKAGL